MFRSLLIVLMFSVLIFAEDNIERIKIAVLNLKNANGITVTDAELISDRLRNEFYSTQRVDVMERDQMQTLLKEQGFQQSGVTCTDEGCMVEMGRLLGVKRLIIGSVGKLGSMYMINIRGINVETGIVEKVVSEDVKGDIENLVEILPKIAGLFTGTYKVSAEISHKEPKKTVEPAHVKSKQTPVVSLPEHDTIRIDCENAILMEEIRFSSSEVGVSVDSFDFRELNEKISNAISEAIDEDITIVPGRSLSAIRCNTPVFKISVKSYTTTPARANQREGKLKIAVSLYKSAKAAAPLISVIFEESGSCHWGDAIPLMNAFDAAIEKIEDDLGDEVENYIE